MIAMQCSEPWGGGMLRMTASTPSLAAAGESLRPGVARNPNHHQRPLPPPPVPPRPSKSVVAEALARTRRGGSAPREGLALAAIEGATAAPAPTRRAPPPPSHPPAAPRGRPPPLPDQPPVATLNGVHHGGTGHHGPPVGRSKSAGRARRLKDTPAPALPSWALADGADGKPPRASTAPGDPPPAVGKASREADGGGRLRSPSKPLVLSAGQGSPGPAGPARSPKSGRRPSPRSPRSPRASPKACPRSPRSQRASPTVLVIEDAASAPSSLDSGKASEEHDADGADTYSSGGSISQRSDSDCGHGAGHVQLRRRSRILQSDWFEVEGDGKEVRYSSCQITIEDPKAVPTAAPLSSSNKGVTVVVSPAVPPVCRSTNLKRLVMASLQGLPPLPKSLSGANLLDGSGLLFTPAEMAAVTGMLPPAPSSTGSAGSAGSGAPSPGSGSGLSHSGSFRGGSRPTPPRGTPPRGTPPPSRNGTPLQCMAVPPPPPPRQRQGSQGSQGPQPGGRTTNLDAQLAVLRKEMVSAAAQT